MSNETSKVRSRILPLLHGAGLDIGAGSDPITPDCLAWDREQGDAKYLPGLAPESFDWVYSSHCLEHIQEPGLALARWWEVLKPSGTLVLIVPDEDTYEQGIWPSAFNAEHAHSFTISKSKSWCPASLNLTSLIQYLPGHKILRLECVDTTQEARLASGTTIKDHTLGAGISHIEAIIMKLPTNQSRPASLLSSRASCPECGKEEIFLGITLEGEIATRCGTCGTLGSYSLPAPKQDLYKPYTPYTEQSHNR